MVQYINAGTYCVGQFYQVAGHLPAFQFRTICERVEVDFVATLQHREHRTVYFAVIHIRKGLNFDDLCNIRQLIRIKNQCTQNSLFEFGRFWQPLNRDRAVIGNLFLRFIGSLFWGCGVKLGFAAHPVSGGGFPIFHRGFTGYSPAVSLEVIVKTFRIRIRSLDRQKIIFDHFERGSNKRPAFSCDFSPYNPLFININISIIINIMI